MLVSHAATTIALVRGLLGNRNLPVRVGCCSLTEFVRKEGNDQKVIGGWEVKKFVDGTHLKDGALRDWGFEDVVIANEDVSAAIESLLALMLLTHHRLSKRRVKSTQCWKKINQ
jgi:hypothetical protein